MYLTRALFKVSAIFILWTSVSLASEVTELVQSEYKKSKSFSNSYTQNLDGSNDSCETLQQNVAMVAAQFTVCAVENARPIRLCLNCAGIYEDVINAHVKLINSTSRFEGVKCSDIFFKSDTLAVIDMIYSGVLNLWSEAFCDGCYTEDGKTNYSHVSPDTEKFFNTWVELMRCVNLTSTDLENVTCKNCSTLYHKVDSIYDEMRKQSSSPLCMDIIDTMNVTRHQWNYHFLCKHFSTNIGYSNIILTVLIAFLPITFYTVARFISVIEVINIVQPKRRSFLVDNH